MRRSPKRPGARAGGEPPVYIIGSEVPVPGGATRALDELAVTTPAAAHATLEAHRRPSARRGSQDGLARGSSAWWCSPGVEFDHHQVIDYGRAKARALSRAHRGDARDGVRSALHRLSNAGRTEGAGARTISPSSRWARASPSRCVRRSGRCRISRRNWTHAGDSFKDTMLESRCAGSAALAGLLRGPGAPASSTCSSA